jgi:cellulase
MKTAAIIAFASAGLVQMASAHTTIQLTWTGATNNDATGIRKPASNFPIKDTTSTDMGCNVNGGTAAAGSVKVKAGDKFTFEWHHDSVSASDDIIASSHHGPIMTYISPASGNGQTGWVKIAEEGYSGGKWAVDNLITNKGKHVITIPDVADGDYILRDEILALHEANNQGGAQFYPDCVQVTVSGGSKTLPAGKAANKLYTATDKGVLFDIYSGFSTYPIPGPAVWDGASSGSSPAAPVSSKPAAISTAAPVQTSAAVANPRPTTFATVVKPMPTAAPSAPKPTSGPGNGSGSVQKYGQCGGKGYTGATICADGWTCKAQNDYYSQCLSA